LGTHPEDSVYKTGTGVREKSLRSGTNNEDFSLNAAKKCQYLRSGAFHDEVKASSVREVVVTSAPVSPAGVSDRTDK
jgi:hypothetical protein